SNVKQKMSVIFNNAREAAGTLANKYSRSGALIGVARERASAGDIDGALSELRTDDLEAFRLWLTYAETPRNHGLVDAANAIIQKIEPNTGNLKRKDLFTPDSWAADSDSVWSALSEWKLKYNDMSGARAAAQKITNQKTRDDTLEKI